MLFTPSLMTQQSIFVACRSCCPTPTICPYVKCIFFIYISIFCEIASWHCQGDFSKKILSMIIIFRRRIYPKDQKREETDRFISIFDLFQQFNHSKYLPKTLHWLRNIYISYNNFHLLRVTRHDLRNKDAKSN